MDHLHVRLLRAVLPPVAGLIHLPTRLVARAAAVAIQLGIEMSINAAEGPGLPALGRLGADPVPIGPVAAEGRIMGPPMEAPRQRRGIRPRHAVRALTCRVDAAQLLHGRLVPLIPVAIRPVEAQELGVRRVLLAVKAFRP